MISLGVVRGPALGFGHLRVELSFFLSVVPNYLSVVPIFLSTMPPPGKRRPPAWRRSLAWTVKVEKVAPKLHHAAAGPRRRRNFGAKRGFPLLGLGNAFPQVVISPRRHGDIPMWILEIHIWIWEILIWILTNLIWILKIPFWILEILFWILYKRTKNRRMALFWPYLDPHFGWIPVHVWAVLWSTCCRFHWKM